VIAALVLPGFAPFSTGPAGGTVLRGVFPGGARPGFVYLPPDYDPSHRYPVLYLLHGMPGSPSEYVSATNLVADADAGIADGRLRPFIAVVPAAGPDPKYNGEWAGPWARELVTQIVPWIDGHLATIAAARGRVLAGLSAGGFGAADIGLRNPSDFGSIASWSGYFAPLHDGPFKRSSAAVLRANDPLLLAVADRAVLARAGTRFFLATGPAHSHWFRPAQTAAFAAELRRLDLPVTTFSYAQTRGEWSAQLDAGLAWAFGATSKLTLHVVGRAARSSTASCAFLISARVREGGRQVTCLTAVRGFPGPHSVIRSSGTMTFRLAQGTIRARVAVTQRFGANGASATQTLSGSIVGGSGRYAGVRGTMTGGGTLVDTRAALRSLELVYRLSFSR
jgi:S-formylglutathione hydrolase FrmB